MHSKIFQIGKKPIDKDEYDSPSDFYDNSSDFADYIGDPVGDEDRDEYVGYLAHALRGVFKPAGRDCLVYLGENALRTFLQEWADKIKCMANELTADNILKNLRLYNIRATTNDTHRREDFRIHIEEWNGWAGPFGDIIEWAACQLKEGDKIYVGAIIDYHF